MYDAPKRRGRCLHRLIGVFDIAGLQSWKTYMRRVTYVTFSSQLPSEPKLTKIGRNIIEEQIHKIIGDFTNNLELIFFELGSPTRKQRSHA